MIVSKSYQFNQIHIAKKGQLVQYVFTNTAMLVGQMGTALNLLVLQKK